MTVRRENEKRRSLTTADEFLARHVFVENHRLVVVALAGTRVVLL